MARLSPAVQILAAISALAGVGVVLRWAGANLAMVAVSLLLFGVFTTAVTSRSIGVGTAAAAALMLNYFFLPPFGTLHIASAEDWVLFLLFIVASLGTSSVISFARREAREARKRNDEVEAVYKLGVELFSAESRGEQFTELARRALLSAGARAGALFLVRGEELECESIIPSDVSRSMEMRARDVIRKAQRSVIRRPDRVEVYIPLAHEGSVEAVLCADGDIDPDVVESLGTLLSLAFHRERFHAMQLALAALDESDRAKTNVLRAVAHDLSTPLTALRIQIEALQRLLPGSPLEALETTRNVAEEAHRLQRRIRNLLTMARIEAGRYKTLQQPTSAADLFKLTRDSVRASLPRRSFTVDIDPSCDDAFADPALCLEILVNLVENADSASPTDIPIELLARTAADRVELSVMDRGTGFREDRASLSGDERGLGLTIARTFAQMNGGSIELRGREGGGTMATLSLPAARTSAA